MDNQLLLFLQPSDMEDNECCHSRDCDNTKDNLELRAAVACILILSKLCTYIVTSVYSSPSIVFLGIEIIRIQRKYIVKAEQLPVGVGMKELLDCCISVRNCRQYC